MNSVIITLGKDVELRITDGDLWIEEQRHSGRCVYLGPATTTRLANIQECLERMKVHCTNG